MDISFGPPPSPVVYVYAQVTRAIHLSHHKQYIKLKAWVENGKALCRSVGAATGFSVQSKAQSPRVGTLIRDLPDLPSVLGRTKCP
jgi:hypothetical protein